MSLSNLMGFKKEDDFEMQVFRCGGKGGQKQNKASSGVRFIHRDSGATGESRESRQQIENKKRAFSRLVSSEKFNKWLKVEINKKCNKLYNIESEVDDQMNPKNIQLEVKNEKGLWEKVNDIQETV